MNALHNKPADLRHVEAWVFDLDNTLYPAACNLFTQIDQRMGAFIAELFQIDAIEARRIQKGFLHSHGTTLTGLMEVHGLAPQGFLDYVHDINLGTLSPDPALQAAIARLPGRRLIYTNGSLGHAERVLARLGLSAYFDAVHDIAAADYCPKPRRAAYEELIRRHGLAPAASAMIEDMPINLMVPHELGMTTVLVAGDKPWRRPEDPPEAEPVGEHLHYTADNLAGFLAAALLKA